MMQNNVIFAKALYQTSHTSQWPTELSKVYKVNENLQNKNEHPENVQNKKFENLQNENEHPENVQDKKPKPKAPSYYKKPAGVTGGTPYLKGSKIMRLTCIKLVIPVPTFISIHTLKPKESSC